MPLGSVADRRRSTRTRDRAVNNRLSEDRRGLEDRPHAHLARPPQSFARAAVRDDAGHRLDDEAADETLSTRSHSCAADARRAWFHPASEIALRARRRGAGAAFDWLPFFCGVFGGP